jgi:hypothetical protein
MTDTGAWIFGGEQGKGRIIKAGEGAYHVIIEGKTPVVRKTLAAAERYAKRATDYTVLVAVA